MAEVVSRSLVFGGSGCILGQDGHAANGIHYFGGGWMFLIHFPALGIEQLLLGVLLGILIEFAFATQAAEVVSLAAVLTATGRSLRVHLHSANNVLFHCCFTSFSQLLLWS
jgi:hypothetical protein